jgi:hypothetical protein
VVLVIKMACVAVAAAFVLATAGCGADGSSNDESTPAEQAGAQDGGDAQGGGDPNSALCSDEGTTGTVALGLGIQLLAQPSLDTVTAVRSGESAFTELYDVEGMREGISDYRVLEGRPADGYDDPKVVLDQWEDLVARMDDMINGTSEPTQADIDAYVAAMGDPQDLIGSQLDLALARDNYCS